MKFAFAKCFLTALLLGAACAGASAQNMPPAEGGQPGAAIAASGAENAAVSAAPAAVEVSSSPASAPVQVSTAAAAEQVPVSTGTVAAESSATVSAAPVSTAAVSDENSPGQPPWMICDTGVEGLVSVKPRVVSKNTIAKKGHLYQREDINKDIQSLIKLGDFSKAVVDISAMPGNMEDKETALPYPCRMLTYRVTERPRVDSVSFEGRHEISKGVLLDEMSLKEDDPYDEVKLQDDMRKLKEKYAQKGYINAKVEFSQVPSRKKNEVSVKIIISEGAQSRVKTQEFSGAAGYTRKKLSKQTKNRPGKIYSPADLPSDKKEIENLYRNDGYSDFTIDGPTVTFSAAQDEVYISYRVSEGAKSVFGNTTFSGNSVIKSTDLAAAVEYRKGDIFKQERFDGTVRAIQEKYADVGRLKAVVKPEKKHNERTGALDINFDVTENPVVYVDHVDVGGNKQTKTYVLRREIVVKDGDVFRASRIRKSYERLMNLGFLDDVGVDTVPTADPDKVDLVFDVVEGKAGMLTLGASVSSVDGLFGDVSTQLMNLFGKAQRLALRWQFGARVLNYTLSWTTPWVKDKPVSFGVDVFDTRMIRPYATSLSAYTDHRVGGRVRLGPRFEEDRYQLNLAYSYEKVEVTNVQDIYADVLPAGTSTTSKIAAEFAVDTRDSIWDPTRGMRNAVSFELSGGPLFGDVNTYKTGATSTWNYKLFSIADYPFVWGISNRFGLIGRYGSTTDIPVYDRYFLGGPDTIRGYDNNGQIGPLNGGSVFYIFNTEVRFPIARERRRTIVQGAFFMDMGNDWSNLSDIHLQTGPDVNQMKIGAGFGIRFTTPAFPIRLDWGYGFNHRDGEQRAQLYFTMGNLF
ncbi:MAG: outer membrane protein assembly factor BamA [Elusimicrobiales bacterium]